MKHKEKKWIFMVRMKCESKIILSNVCMKIKTNYPSRKIKKTIKIKIPVKRDYRIRIKTLKRLEVENK